MSLILSHATARLFYQTTARPGLFGAVPLYRAGSEPVPFSGEPPTRKTVERARTMLQSYGVPLEELGVLDVLVFKPQDRRCRKDVVCHLHRGGVTEGGVPYALVRHIARDVWVVSPGLCALQAAEQLEFRECVEYYYELCGRYRLPLEAHGTYAECRPATSTAELRDVFDACSGSWGAKRARRAIGYVRDGARSPMETALMMMLVMPKSEGGLGIRDIEMDVRIPVSGYATKLTTSRCFFSDIFLRRAQLSIEYGGIVHEEASRMASDNERTNALRAMGYDVIDVSRQNFFDRDAFRRTMAAISRKAGIRPSQLPEGFGWKQEELRRFVLRRWLDDDAPERRVVLPEDSFVYELPQDDWVC